MSAGARKDDSDPVVSGGSEKIWVACNKCDKWRALPSSVGTSSTHKAGFESIRVFQNALKSPPSPPPQI